MKNNFYYLFFVLCAYSCKKQDQLVKDEIKHDVQLNGDYLVFKDYQTFFNYYKVVDGMNKGERESWEKSLNFTSMLTAYENFNEELDELEKGPEKNYFKGFSQLKQKYKGSLIFTEDSYRLNNSGVRESILTNKDGIVKVGQDYLHFGEKGITTYKDETFQNSEDLMNSKSASIANIVLTPPQPNHFILVVGEWNAVYKDRGRVIFRTKGYNFHSSALGYQSFATLEGMAEHKNIFGTWRDVRMSLNLVPNGGRSGVAIEYQNLSNTMIPGNREGIKTSNIVNLKPNFFEGLYDVERFDRVMLVTKGLETNPHAALPHVSGTNTEFLNYAVDLLYANATDVYWKDISIRYVLISAFIQPGGVLGNPKVNFDPFKLDGDSPIQHQ